MSSIKSLAKYIYESQKQGFSDPEIINLLEESGWQSEEIEKALKRASRFHLADKMISAPVSYLKKSAEFAIFFVAALPNKIAGAFMLVVGEVAAAIKYVGGAISLFIRKIFIGIPQKIFQKTSLYFAYKKEQKKFRLNAISELSKYICKGLKRGVLESDLFVELLQSQWDKKIIEKAFSKAYSTIFWENVAAFLKFLALLPVRATKTIVMLPVAIVVAPVKLFIALSKQALRFVASAKENIRQFALRIKSRAKAPRKPKVKIPKVPVAAKYGLSLSIFFQKALKRIIGRIIFLPKRLYGYLSRSLSQFKRRRALSARFFLNSVKYFVRRYPSAAKRIWQSAAYSFGRFIKHSPKKLLAAAAYVWEFFRYDFWTSLKYWLAPKTISAFFSAVINVLLFPFVLLFRIARKMARVVSGIDLAKFNIPFEMAEHLILKIWHIFKIIFSPIVRMLAVIFGVVKRFAISIIPKRKEKGVVAEYLPQTLVEVPVGKVPNTMKVMDILRLSVRMFKTRRMRTFLTILGIGIGIGAILFLVSLGYGLQRILIEEIATSDALLSLDVSTRDEELIPLNKEVLDKFEAMPEVAYVSPLVSIPGQVSLENTTANTIINGVRPNYFKLGGVNVGVGKLFAEGEEDSVIISLPIVKLLNLGRTDGEVPREQLEKIIGKEVSIVLLVPFKTDIGEEVKTVEFEKKFKIAGVMEDFAESFIYMPLPPLENVGITKYQSAKVRVADSGVMEIVRAQAVSLGFVVAALSDTIEQANKVFRVLQIVLALFGIVALAVSAIGMFNTMTIALLERTQEIGIMKSLGASNRNVWELFLAESIMMGFLGGVGGILVGYLGSEGLNLTVRLLAGALGGRMVDLFERPWWFIITILVFSTVVGLFTGLWPARRAAHINILQALRYK